MLTLDAAGVELAELRYKAFGETRYSSGDTPTAFRYTGQREEVDMGLYYYNARWYDPMVGRFVSADTVVPGVGDPQAWNRYGYVLNNPLLYTDPSGHRGCIDEECRYVVHPVSGEIIDVEGEPPPESITEYPDYNYRDAARTTLGLIVNWFFGLGPDTYVFTADL